MNTLAAEAQEIVWEVADPRPGETVKAQMNRSCDGLGYPRGHWRVRDAWYGYAGCWSARAMDDLRKRHEAWTQRQQRRAAESERLAVAEAKAHRARLETIKDALERTDPDFYRADVAALERAIGVLGGGRRTMDGDD